MFNNCLRHRFVTFCQRARSDFGTSVPTLFHQRLVHRTRCLPLTRALFLTKGVPGDTHLSGLLATAIGPTATIVGTRRTRGGSIVGRSRTIVGRVAIINERMIKFPVHRGGHADRHAHGRILVLSFRRLHLIGRRGIVDGGQDGVSRAVLLQCCRLHWWTGHLTGHLEVLLDGHRAVVDLYR